MKKPLLFKVNSQKAKAFPLAGRTRQASSGFLSAVPGPEFKTKANALYRKQLASNNADDASKQQPSSRAVRRRKSPPTQLPFKLIKAGEKKRGLQTRGESVKKEVPRKS